MFQPLIALEFKLSNHGNGQGVGQAIRYEISATCLPPVREDPVKVVSNIAVLIKSS